jgi:hypothetical protein
MSQVVKFAPANRRQCCRYDKDFCLSECPAVCPRQHTGQKGFLVYQGIQDDVDMIEFVYPLADQVQQKPKLKTRDKIKRCKKILARLDGVPGTSRKFNRVLATLNECYRRKYHVQFSQGEFLFTFSDSVRRVVIPKANGVICIDEIDQRQYSNKTRTQDDFALTECYRIWLKCTDEPVLMTLTEGVTIDPFFTFAFNLLRSLGIRVVSERALYERFRKLGLHHNQFIFFKD